MKLELVRRSDLEEVMKFYHYVIEHSNRMEQYAKWKIGLHPASDTVLAYIDEQAMYVYKKDGRIAAAMAVTMKQGEDYHAVEWGEELADDEVAVVHILGVNPDNQREGVGNLMIDEAVELAKSRNRKALRLDTLASNTPAQLLYKGKGLTYRGKQNLYAGNTGWIDFLYYELPL